MKKKADSIRSYQAEIRQKIRTEAPEISTAVRFLPARQRAPVLAVAAFCRLLDSIISPTKTGADRPTSSGHPEAIVEAPNNRAAGGETAGSPVEDQAAACPCSSNGGALEMPPLIAANIIKFVYHEAPRGEVGQAEIELFLALREHCNLPESACRALVTAEAEFLSRKRFATERALGEALDRISIPLVELFLPVVSPTADVRTFEALPIEQQAGLRGLGRAVILTQHWPRLKPGWLERGQLLVPLDLLAARGWRDRDFIRFMQQPADPPTATGFEILEDFADLIYKYYTDSSVGLAALQPTTTMRALIFWGLHWQAEHDSWCRAVLGEWRVGGDQRRVLLWELAENRRSSARSRSADLRMVVQALTLNTKALQKRGADWSDFQTRPAS